MQTCHKVLAIIPHPEVITVMHGFFPESLNGLEKRICLASDNPRQRTKENWVSSFRRFHCVMLAEDSLGYPLFLRNKGGPSGSGSQLAEKGSVPLTASEGFETAAGKIWKGYTIPTSGILSNHVHG